MDIGTAAAALQKFTETGLTGALARIEGEPKGAIRAASLAVLCSSGDEKQALGVHSRSHLATRERR